MNNECVRVLVPQGGHSAAKDMGQHWRRAAERHLPLGGQEQDDGYVHVSRGLL
jgi:hypothetical protein